VNFGDNTVTVLSARYTECVLAFRIAGETFATPQRENDTITLGGGVKIQVLSITGNGVRLGFHAPQEVKIERDDIRNREPRERNAPTKSVPGIGGGWRSQNE
jgi:carbon storage regulator CsrA